ncbi:MAG: tetratricopeptide repeat protein [Chloroherpetonaceae bacterium]|nr:tetratricopeptide repeat protein [Chloroherpetonaceae bacterium]
MTTSQLSTRIEFLKSFLEKDPNDSFSRYALALDYLNSGDISLAVEEFERLLKIDPNYSATYYHFGKVLERLGKTSEAKELYQKGIELTTKKGEAHALKELKEALFTLTLSEED